MEEEKIETFKIKYIPTGNIFDLPKEECDRLILEESINFEVVDENYVAPVIVEPASIMNQIIVDDKANTEGEDESHDDVDEVNPYKDLKDKKAVVALLKERNIGYGSSATRAELEAILIADDKANTEGN